MWVGGMEAIHIPRIGGDRIKAYKKYGIGSRLLLEINTYI